MLTKFAQNDRSILNQEDLKDGEYQSSGFGTLPSRCELILTLDDKFYSNTNQITNVGK